MGEYIKDRKLCACCRYSTERKKEFVPAENEAPAAVESAGTSGDA